MRAVIKKCRNGGSVRIPAAVLRAAHLNLDEPVVVREESGRVIIERAGPKACDISELVKGITREISMTRLIWAVLQNTAEMRRKPNDLNDIGLSGRLAAGNEKVSSRCAGRLWLSPMAPSARSIRQC